MLVPHIWKSGVYIFSLAPLAIPAQVTQDIGPIFLPNVGSILVTILDQYWSETLANIGPIFDRYRTTFDQYCTNNQPICNQYYLLYLSFSRFPLPPLIHVGFFSFPGIREWENSFPGFPGNYRESRETECIN